MTSVELAQRYVRALWDRYGCPPGAASQQHDSVNTSFRKALLILAGEGCSSPEVGCLPVTDAVVYSGGSNDPQAVPWVVVGGTAATVGFDVQVTGSITELYVQNAAGIPWYDGTFDFTPIASCLTRLGFDYTFITTPPDVTGLTALEWIALNTTAITSFPQQVNPSVTSFQIYCDPSEFLSQVLTDVDCSGFTNAQLIGIVNNSVLTSVNVTGCTELTYLQVNLNASLTTLNIAGCVKIITFEGIGGAFDEATVDHILTTLDSNGLSNGTCSLNFGTNATPSATGLAAKANLISKGWTVTTN